MKIEIEVVVVVELGVVVVKAEVMDAGCGGGGGCGGCNDEHLHGLLVVLAELLLQPVRADVQGVEAALLQRVLPAALRAHDARVRAQDHLVQVQVQGQVQVQVHVHLVQTFLSHLLLRTFQNMSFPSSSTLSNWGVAVVVVVMMSTYMASW